MESKNIQRSMTQIYKIVRHLEKEAEAHLLILSLNSRTGSLQKGSKQTEGWDTSHSTLLNSLFQDVQGVQTLHAF